MINKHFVLFVSPGTFFNEERMIPIDSWDVDRAVEMARDVVERHGATPFAFCFVTKGRKEDELDSREIERSGRYYLGGEILTLEQVEARNDPDDRILISNMKSNGHSRIIVNRNSYRSTQPFLEGDTVLEYDAARQ